MRIFVLTSDGYSHSVLGFSYLFNKYWGNDQEVIVAGYNKFPPGLPANFTKHRIGRQEDYPVNKWSDGLIGLLKDFPQDEVFLLFFEDYWLTEPVHLREVNMLHDYMLQFRYVLKMDMYTDRRYAAGVQKYGACGHIPLLKSDYNSQYHFSLMAGIWNREIMMQVLIPGESPWDVEMRGTERLARCGDDVLVLGTDSWDDNPKTCPIRHTLAYRNGDPSKLLLGEIKPEDVDAMKESGYI